MLSLHHSQFPDSQALLNHVRRLLAGYLDKNGKVFYSGFDTYQRGHAIFLGYNPGGTGADTLANRLLTLPEGSWNHFLCEEWGKRGGVNPLQRRTQSLFQKLGLDLHRDVFTSNLYFWNTPAMAGLAERKFNEFKQACSKVIGHFLSAVPARVVICNGNRTFLELLYWLDPEHAKERDYYQATELHSFGRRGKILLTDRAWDGRQFRIIGVPHLSWVDVATNETAVQGLREALRTAVPGAGTSTVSSSVSSIG